MDLGEFLLARISEDEAAYRDAMHMGCVEDVSDGPDVIHSATCPNRVLAECDAKRRIVERWQEHQGWANGESGALCLDLIGEQRFREKGTALNEVLRLLAVPYADHPDYDQEWKP